MVRTRSVSTKRSGSGRHRVWLVGLIIATFFLFIAASVVIVIGGYGDEDNPPIIFDQTIEAVSDANIRDITPPDWLFAIVWPAIFFYQLFWIIYAMGLICRRPKDRKGYLYFRPPFLPPAVYILFIIALALAVGWVFLWTEELLELAFFALLLSAIFLIAALGVAAHSLVAHGRELIKVGNAKDVALDRGLVQNGLGLFAAWVFFAAHINLSIVLFREWGVGSETADTVALAIYGGFIVLYFILDIAAFSVALRFVLTPYVIFALSLAAILTNDWEFSDRNCLLAFFLLAFAGFAFVFKLASMIFLSMRDREPLLLDDDSDSEEDEDTDSESMDTDTEDEDTERYMKKAKKLLSR